MKEYLIVILENDKKIVVIDQLEKDNIIYFLTTEINEETNEISDDFVICVYNENTNLIEEIENPELYEEIEILFDERLEKNSIEYDLLENINSKEFIELKIKDIKDNAYILEYEDKVIEKSFEFFTNTKPKINDTMYIYKGLLDIKLLSYGHFNNFENIREEDVLILKSDKYRVLYRRLYG